MAARDKELMKRTTGDQYEVPCPACGHIIRDLWDLKRGLCEGDTIDCGRCEAEITIESMDVVAYITLAAAGKEE